MAEGGASNQQTAPGDWPQQPAPGNQQPVPSPWPQQPVFSTQPPAYGNQPALGHSSLRPATGSNRAAEADTEGEAEDAAMLPAWSAMGRRKRARSRSGRR
jgi:hypothetical protein